MNEEYINALSNLINGINGIISIEPDSLVQLDRLGNEMSFLDGMRYFTEFKFFFESLSRITTTYDMPLGKIVEISNQADQIREIYIQIKNFSPSSSNAITLRDSILSNLNQHYKITFELLIPILTYFQLRKSNVSTLELEIENRRSDLNEAVKEVKLISETAATEVDSILKLARDTAAHTGVSQHAGIFGDEAKRYAKASWVWIIATLAAGILTISWGLWGNNLIVEIENSETTYGMIRFFSSKIIVLSILTYVLVWCSRNYSASRHNFVVNKHRMNALNTFKTFVAAAGEDQEVKDAVLLQATNTIFSSQPSGYINKESDNPSNKTIEIVRTSSNIVGSLSKMSKSD